MHDASVSRREFVLTAAALLAARPAAAAQRGLTAQQIVDRIRANVGLPWRDQTVDGFKAGDPTAPVAGISVAVMATMTALRSAAAAGHNLVITHEPTFYAANDNPGPRATDPVYLAKRSFIEERQLVVWRFVDHWNARQPREVPRALAAALGWTRYQSPDNELIYRLPETTVGAVASQVRKALTVRGGIRQVGAGTLRVRTVLLSPGTTDVPTIVRNLRDVDLILSGEPREWEAVPYILDGLSAGQQKGLLALGRLVSLEPGMRACADWIRTIVPEIRVSTALPATDPYWSPAS
jgi:putative NIF3 family GTP cyclohydrolase 1 type 2